MVGALGLRPTLRAIEAGKDIAFANKEVLVVAGEVVTRAAQRHRSGCCRWTASITRSSNVSRGASGRQIKRIILTASGGPFRTLPIDRFEASRWPTR